MERSANQRNLLQWGSLGTSGGAVLLLVSALGMLDRQGDEITDLRQRLDDMARSRIAEQTDTELQVVRLRHQIQRVQDDVTRAQQYDRDPGARPDGWTRSQDTRRMGEFREEVQQLLAAERQRWVGEGGPLHLQQLLDIQRAIAGIPTDAPDAWTTDGRPRVQSVAQRLGSPVSESQRDRAWFLLQAAKTLTR